VRARVALAVVLTLAVPVTIALALTTVAVALTAVALALTTAVLTLTAATLAAMVTTAAVPAMVTNAAVPAVRERGRREQEEAGEREEAAGEQPGDSMLASLHSRHPLGAGAQPAPTFDATAGDLEPLAHLTWPTSPGPPHPAHLTWPTHLGG
jgi:hypothetical protein